MGNYRYLEVWKKAHRLTLDVYRATSKYPPAESFGLIGQTRRAAASIPMNLAEGCGRNSDNELRRFSRISLGSANELTYQLLLAYDLCFLEADNFATLDSQTTEVTRMLVGLANALPSRRR